MDPCDVNCSGFMIDCQGTTLDTYQGFDVVSLIVILLAGWLLIELMFGGLIGTILIPWAWDKFKSRREE